MNDQQLPELTIVRVLKASRERVWKAWTDPKELQAWWGPRGVTNATCEFDARPQGAIHIGMLAGAELGAFAGQEWPMTGTVVELDAPKKLVFSSTAIIDGKPILEHTATMTLEEEGEKTKMTLHIQVTRVTPEAAGPLMGMEAGWTQSIDKLEEFVTG